MGLLDDAIREHLDLKRRHGADPAEVARAERDALGPVRRAPERTAEDDLPEAEAEVAEHDELTDPDLPYDEPVGDDDDEPFGREDDEPYGREHDEPALPFAGEDDARPLAEPVQHDESTARRAYDQTADLGAPAPHRADPYAAEPPATAPAPADPQSHGYADHTTEYDVEEALGAERAWPDESDAEPGQEGEDVLEETPEFLQDTPDHDRLWFEQRPPRDFDFDK